MKRTYSEELKSWLAGPHRKPLLLKGARQVGKTHLLKDFCEQSGRKSHYFDFREQKELRTVFKEAPNFQEVLKLLEYSSNEKIDIEHDLLILDELQECPGGVPALKDFCEKTPNLAVIAAGSHIGLTVHEDPFPVGKVDIGYLSPMTFEEFLLAKNPAAYEKYQSIDLSTRQPISSLIHDSLMNLFTCYTIVGGMPEAVAAYAEETQDSIDTFKRVRMIQRNLEEGYKADFVKYAGKEKANLILDVFEAIPTQLGKAHDDSVAKFSFSRVGSSKKGYAQVRGPLSWLSTSKLCIQVKIASRAEYPLAGYTHDNKFKLYLFDVGLLQSMLGIPPAVVLSNKLGSYKGYLVENVVAQEMFAEGHPTLHSLEEGRSEIEFLLPQDDGIAPVEVKASSRSRRAKSLNAFCERYSPSIGYKITSQNIGYNDATGIVTVPLYLCGKLRSLISSYL